MSSQKAKPTAKEGTRRRTCRQSRHLARMPRNPHMGTQGGKELLDRAFDELERETPNRITRLIRWVRNPKSKWIRLPLGILCIIASFFWFLPVIGIELLPIGLLLIAQDVPFLRKPVARMTLWIEGKWVDARRRFTKRR